MKKSYTIIFTYCALILLLTVGFAYTPTKSIKDIDENKPIYQIGDTVWVQKISSGLMIQYEVIDNNYAHDEHLILLKQMEYVPEGGYFKHFEDE
jgi:hypothetical protein